MRTITLKTRKNDRVLHGHPWVFESAIDREEGFGDVARVVTKKGRHVGDGFYSDFSNIRVRITESTVIDDLVAAAWKRRQILVGPDTNGFRWFNAEGDGLGGLTIDFWNGCVVFQASTLPVFNRAQEVVDAVLSQQPDAHVLQISPSDVICNLEGLPTIDSRWHTEPMSHAAFLENGVRYEIDTSTVQKTGHYADMRPHRAFIGSISGGKSVLDLYAYTGGFALNAKSAARVVAVDSSRAATEVLSKNAALNGAEIEVITDKVERALQDFKDREERFDVIVLDPPKLAPNRNSLAKAMKKKAGLIRDAASRLNPGGTLAIGSCSALIGQPEIERLLSMNTKNSRVIWRGGQAPCHPYLPVMPEGKYLSFVAAIVD